MKKSIMLALSDEELLELYQTIIDEDEGEALHFLEKYLKIEVQKLLQGIGHCTLGLRHWDEDQHEEALRCHSSIFSFCSLQELGLALPRGFSALAAASSWCR